MALIAKSCDGVRYARVFEYFRTPAPVAIQPVEAELVLLGSFNHWVSKSEALQASDTALVVQFKKFECRKGALIV